jgi:hypothetical protein
MQLVKHPGHRSSKNLVEARGRIQERTHSISLISTTAVKNGLKITQHTGMLRIGSLGLTLTPLVGVLRKCTSKNLKRINAFRDFTI